MEQDQTEPELADRAKVACAPDKEFGSRDCAVITGFNLGEPDGLKKWAAAGGRQKFTALIEKTFQITYEYLDDAKPS